jgi:hypothetical protein
MTMQRGLVVGLSVALGAALLAIAFLLGRGSRSPEPAPTALVTASPSSEGSAADETPEPAPLTQTAPTAEADSPESQAETPAEDLAATTAPPSAESGAMRDEVVRYFAEVDAIQAGSRSMSGDPQAVASAMLKQAAGGDTSEIDTLVESQRAVLARLRDVSAPPPCASHLQGSIAAVADGLELLGSVRDALASGSIGDLGSLTAKGQDLERRAREIDAQAAEIRKRYGI